MQAPSPLLTPISARTLILIICLHFLSHLGALRLGSRAVIIWSMEYVDLSLESEIRVFCCNGFCLSLTQLIWSIQPLPRRVRLGTHLYEDLLHLFRHGIFLLHSSLDSLLFCLEAFVVQSLFLALVLLVFSFLVCFFIRESHSFCRESCRSDFESAQHENRDVPGHILRYRADCRPDRFDFVISWLQSSQPRLVLSFFCSICLVDTDSDLNECARFVYASLYDASDKFVIVVWHQFSFSCSVLCPSLLPCHVCFAFCVVSWLLVKPHMLWFTACHPYLSVEWHHLQPRWTRLCLCDWFGTQRKQCLPPRVCYRINHHQTPDRAK